VLGNTSTNPESHAQLAGEFVTLAWISTDKNSPKI